MARFIVTKEPVTLLELASWMAGKVESGGLGCHSAVNLSGADSAAAAFYSPGRSLNQNPNLVVGEGVYPQASFLSVTAK